ncbi:CDP-diacylglycerol--glycerol-3-phosphate 3-phosphatidyltransferase [Chryseobacterium bernardetii]|jgi:CDP-diacylglycerol--glycerol-3-phosphate 3-phosphatidyltransferase|uniref:CDP-diacylglycerol--glycerol-3-phosphate 3-phosphatidyltransferase n=2 Tax=Chryseobacterium TaxID=59732 RepID=A0A543EHB9_9FLAO|nr:MULTISPECIES: CDP-alcohol phosphatidyltransferase family protein [Chryseobacterium]MDR6373016.1 CDP-diacylglycerol--glycerol-3-phosphate 3-phosphatidyltransferase [Chryseobacterium vietnamense]MDR6443454.1 CDP-diacylglycerol--glycerol-3-phosphate 3-phosphatidyltransferase [Chryseobacterium bernardetii]MDR6486150.1 CDP-diacylglycerol--glycerol-3-phosphate 3-phosphatidyltransferase [Chryseobacterium vietnamense]TQM20899.1 CDP-diacylglycerol--glycerol-3-phosphate 3-phosphatidyltransferase [Chry
MKSKIPVILIFSRLIIGFIIIALSLIKIENYQAITVVLLSIGLLTDIFDGIIARYLHVSTQKLRRMDSTVDQVFFISVGVAAYIQCPEFFKTNVSRISILAGAEALIYLVSFLKFRKEVATHSIGAKIWTLLLFGTLIQVILQCRSIILFNLCFWVGLLTRAEIIAILLLLKTWTNDVPSVFHSIQLRKGKTIKKSKMFNS